MHAETIVSDSTLFDMLAAKAAALRDEAEKIEHFALYTLKNKGGEEAAAGEKMRTAATSGTYVPKNPKLTDTIETLISAAGGKMDRKDIIKEVKRLSRGHTKHIAVVAALRNADRFKDIGNGVFALAK